MLRRLVLAALIVALAVSAQRLAVPSGVARAQAAGATWTQYQFASPPGRGGAGMAFDAATSNVLLFSGYNGTSDVNDTWSWNGSAWTQLVSPGCTTSCPASPPARDSASMAYDAATGKVVVFGGASGGSTLNDTWSWGGGAWTQLVSPGCTSACPISPSARFGQSMAYDAATGTIVLFGGGASCGGLCNDTWSFNGSAWTQLVSPGCGASCPNSPPARYVASMAYDAASGTVLLFGGTDSSSNLNDIWSFNGSAWTQLIANGAAGSPSARYGMGLTYDAATSAIILFGGYNGSSNLNDTWSFNGSAWTELIANGASGSPAARYGVGMTYDAATGTIVLFGGSTGSHPNDTWSFNGSAWSNVTPVSPPGRFQASMAYDAATGTALLFGGQGACGGFCNDTWGWNGSAWTQLVSPGCTNSCPNSPSGRVGASMAYDAATSAIILFGGNSASVIYNDTWGWTGSAWTQLISPGCTNACSSSPPARAVASMAYDAATGGAVLFGGTNGGGYLNDTWSWYNGEWTQLIANGTSGNPAARGYASMAYDAATGYIVLFGGYNGSCCLGDTWSWIGSYWSNVYSAASPTARFGPSMAYDASTQTLLLFGGSDFTSNYNDTWAWNSNGWTPLIPAGASGSPSGRYQASMTYDTATNSVLLFGGFGGGYMGDMWSYPTLPAVTGLYPSSGPAGGGTTVAISGSGFSTAPGGTAVSFGATAAQIATPSPGSAALRRPLPGGEALSPLPLGEAPTTASRAPLGSQEGQGEGAQPTAGSVSVSCVSTTLCYAISPPGNGIVDVTVTVNGLTSLTNGGDQFTYLATPSVSGLSPSSGPLSGGTLVTISGANLSAARETTTVAFGGVAATSVSCPNIVTCYATSPAGSGTVDVIVSVGGVSSAATSADRFAYVSVQPAPVVTGVNPNSGPPAGGTSVTISGSNLGTGGPATVRFGTSAATGVSCNSGGTSCTVTSPAGEAGLVVDVVVTSGGQSSATSSSDRFTYGSGSGIAQQFSVQPASAQVYLHSIAPLNIVATPGSGTTISSWTVDIGYDPTVLAPAQCVAASGVPADMQTQCNLSYGPGTVRLAQSTATGVNVTESVAVVTFQGIGAMGSSSSLTLQVDGLSNATGVALPSTVQNGLLSITTNRLGDVNGDGVINAVDALCILRAVVALPATATCPSIPSFLGDVNGDGVMNAVDALCVLRNVVGLPGTSACPYFSTPVAVPSAVGAAPTVGAAPSGRPAPGSGLIQLEPGAVTIGSGRNETIAVVADVPQGLGSWTLDVTYDPKQVSITSCEGAAGSLCNATFAAGRVRISGAAASGLSGEQTLARIQVRGRSGASGTAKLGLDVIESSDATGAPLGPSD